MGLVILASSLLLIPPVGRRLGPSRTAKLAFLVFIPMWLMVPMTSLLEGSPGLQLGVLFLFKGMRGMVGSLAYSGSMMLVSNVASPQNRGLVTGAGDTAGCVLNAVGPAVAGLLWRELSVQSFRLHAFFPWFLPSVVSFLLFCLVSVLPKSIDAPYGEMARASSS